MINVLKNSIFFNLDSIYKACFMLSKIAVYLSLDFYKYDNINYQY